ncbi:protein RGF1 INDUCIBLE TRANSCRIPTION FACTOR 1-like isoform X1 [Malania oleifera]|uniref:protein RGF1 INDUCIBLE TRANSCRIPTION FACTOR 1-like isoform X1 n=1 Tax=Malania oleifera TaxID=397392 RepID=UPI0025AEA1CF|nr:protein RGF1 INDUCIBLE TRANSCRIPTION FACTOR 1-like isoform X1 [Malania oleifera]XP_057984257.1 protein RGF1 INDUCIBLE TRANSCRIPTION FACTOR 1-like isoform X1 [Malania oleifera]
MDTMLVPPWLEPLLTTAFFSVCRIHGDAARSECNMYCLDCNGGSFCYYCRSSRHKDHRVIQIRRSSYHDVVRVAEIQKVLDISGVQTYVINSARVLFLNERPQPKAGKGVAHICEICGRSLLDPFRFCSLGCKLVGVKTNRDASFAVDAKNEGAAMGIMGEGISRRAFPSTEEGELREGSQQDIYPPTPSPPTSNARRRKGIPHRAPLGS